jgi:ElaB/YqjD/DUF883 family membrane-anchored ribosome-binding protein
MATTTPKAAKVATPTAKKRVTASLKAAANKAAPKAKATKIVEPETLRSQAGTLLNQAGDKIKGAADQGKTKAGDAMDGLASMVEDVAASLDEKLGAQYGDYARKAASAVSGVADTLKSKEVDELLEGARDFVRNKPAVAIGAAAALGFVLTRLIKAGNDDD